jgi:hypothetical protein
VLNARGTKGIISAVDTEYDGFNDPMDEGDYG